jgi:uncharacterized protein (DUF4415 family)
MEAYLARIDAHVIQPEEYEDIPELDDDWFAAADHYIGGKLIRRGRPKSEEHKVPVSIRLSSDVVARFKATGRGWQTRIDAALAEWLASHPDVGRE